MKLNIWALTLHSTHLTLFTIVIATEPFDNLKLILNLLQNEKKCTPLST